MSEQRQNTTWNSGVPNFNAREAQEDYLTREGYKAVADRAGNPKIDLDASAVMETGKPFPGSEGFKLIAVPDSMVAGVQAIVRELDRAMKKFPNNSVFRSRHEGYGVTAEEIEEWWDAIKNNNHGMGKNQDCAEAVQCGAMFLHYLKDFMS